MTTPLAPIEKENLTVRCTYYEDFFPNFEEMSFEKTEVGPFVHGVRTLIFQGGRDECYIFVLRNSGHAHGSLYELVYSF